MALSLQYVVMGTPGSGGGVYETVYECYTIINSNFLKIADALNDTANSAPTTGEHSAGERVINSEPVELGTNGNRYIVQGWACVEAGTPGTWLDNRVLTGN
jgi:hypothetical protein